MCIVAAGAGARLESCEGIPDRLLAAGALLAGLSERQARCSSGAGLSLGLEPGRWRAKQVSRPARSWIDEAWAVLLDCPGTRALYSRSRFNAVLPFWASSIGFGNVILGLFTAVFGSPRVALERLVVVLMLAMTEDQVLLIEAAREFAESELLACDRAWDEDESSMVEVLPQLAEMGFLNLCISEEYGGLGCTYRTYARILHEISRYSPSTAVSLSVHNMVGMVVRDFALEQKKNEWLSQWGTPESFAAFALTEAGAGSDPGASKTTARKVEGGYRVNGEKMWITNGMHARWFVTLARTDQPGQKSGLSALLVDGNETGIGRDKILGKMGIRGSETAVIHYDDVFVPDDHLLGNEGEGMKACLSALDGGRIGIASQASGIAQACLDEMAAYAKQREQFDQPIANFQAIQEMIADSFTELSAARALIQSAADLMDSGDLEPAASAKAKLFASEAANRIAYRAVQIHGGSGYVKECRVEQLARDVRVTTIYEGTSEIQRVIIARDLLRGH